MLNQAQRRILEIIVDENTINDVSFKSIESVELKCRVLRCCIQMNEPVDEWLRVRTHLLDSFRDNVVAKVIIFRNIYLHPCPQNNCFTYVPSTSEVTEFFNEQQYMGHFNNCKLSTIVEYQDKSGHMVREPCGLLNLTRWNMAASQGVTKSDVIHFIQTRIEQHIFTLVNGEPKELYPDPYLVLFCKANELKQQNKFQEAILSYTETLRHNPRHVDSLNRRGNCYFSMRQYDMAIKDYTAAINIDPCFFKPYFNRGLVYRNKSMLEASLLDYTEALKLNPFDVDLYNNRGNIFADLSLDERALADYNSALSIYSNFFSAHVNRALIYETRRQHILSFQDMKCVVEILACPLKPNEEIDQTKADSYSEWFQEFLKFLKRKSQTKLL